MEYIRGLWNAWEIHCLVLTSLFLQVLLFLTADIRRYRASRILNMVLWLAYLSADAVAVFVLGHLAVRAGEPGHQLMAFWAPFMLIHLGGQETITAFSRQDNELWLRHLLNLVTQAAVAGYIVAKVPWPDHWLRSAMLLLFLSGCFKYAERTCCLYMASSAKLRSTTLMDLSDTLRILNTYDEYLNEGQLKELRRRYGGFKSKQIFEGDLSGSRLAYNDPKLQSGVIKIMSVDAPHNNPWNFFSAFQLPDILSGYKSREGRGAAYEYVGASLVGCYQMLYTKNSLRVSCWVFWAGFLDFSGFNSIYFQCTTFILLYTVFLNASSLIPLLLFWVAEKGGQPHTSRADITVSYILLGGAVALDVSSAITFIISSMSSSSNHLLARVSKAWLTKQWSEELAQYNMIMRHINTTDCRASMRIWISRLLGSWCAKLIEVTHTTPLTKEDGRSPIKEFVLDSLLYFGRTGSEWDVFASSRGKLALQKLPPERRPLPAVEESISASSGTVDFTTSVLIWHIATDLCYYSGNCGNNSPSSNSGPMMERKEMCRELSNYIMYLVFKCGVMLTSNSQLMHDRAHNDIEASFNKYRKSTPGSNSTGEKDAVLKLLDWEQQDEELEDHSTMSPAGIEEYKRKITVFAAEDIEICELVKNVGKSLNSPVLPRARGVAKELINSITDETERWDLIAGVWLEMLYYIAPRCGAAFHYEHLSTGGEFITHVLALMHELGPFLPGPTSRA